MSYLKMARIVFDEIHVHWKLVYTYILIGKGCSAIFLFFTVITRKMDYPLSSSQDCKKTYSSSHSPTHLQVVERTRCVYQMLGGKLEKHNNILIQLSQICVREDWNNSTDEDCIILHSTFRNDQQRRLVNLHLC